MDRFGLRAASFCEQCGLHRDQLGDETVAPFRECPTCSRAVCPNCWNLVGKSCLRCAPFALPLVEPAVAEAAPALAVAAEPVVEPPPKAGRTKRGKRGKAADVVVVTTAAAALTETPATAAADPAAPVARPAKIKTPKLPARRSTKAAAVAPAVVEWPDRSVDWQVRPGMTAAAAPRPAPETPPPPKPIRQDAPRPATTRKGRPGRLTSLVGFLVVAVALFGVAGISLAALGRLPGPHRAVSTAAPEPPTVDTPATTDAVAADPSRHRRPRHR